MFGLDDTTIAGLPIEGDCYGMGYYIQSPDPAKWPLPPEYHEGQWFNLGGNGISDTAFYAHPQEYFNMVFGTGTKLEPEFGSSVAYHARDRRKVYTYLWSLLPGFKIHTPRHQVTDPVDVDFMGSAVALYACPDDEGLHVIENIVLAEGLPHIMIDGKWIRDPSAYRSRLFWDGPYDKCLEYANALGFKDVSRDTGEFYASLGNNWTNGGVKLSAGRTMTGKEFSEEAHQQGMTTWGGLHTLCLFLQGGICSDVTPIASPHLQTVCRTTLAKDISDTETNIVVTDPSFLAENATWPVNESIDGNYVRIGGEIISYKDITRTAPYTLTGVKRGYVTKATAHKESDEVAKLQQNCYHGFCPDMTLMPAYAGYYAELMVRNGMEAIDFDGLESTVYINQGYYGVRIFFRRLFETYAKLTGGKAPRVTASNVFGGAWLYMDACNVGGGNNMFDPIDNQWGIEGKDVRNAFENSYYPGTFGIQNWHSEWSVYDAENLEAKSIGWNATYDLTASRRAIDFTGEKDAIFKAFHTWETARDENIFTPALKEQLQDMRFKSHLEQKNTNTFVLYPIKETRVSGQIEKDASPLEVANPYDSQPMQFSFRLLDPAENVTLILPDGSQIKSNQKIEENQFIICKGDQVYLADKFRRKIVDLDVDHSIKLPTGESKMSVQCPGSAGVRFELVVSAMGKGEEINVSESHI
jgi:hypothetical protein